MKSLKSYTHKDIESKWQKEWSENKIYSPDLRKAENPFYNLMMFPYPSAEGLHAGNMFAFTGSDVYGRFKRMQGFAVIEPIGLDGFGIHSENYALKTNRTPAENAKITQSNYYKQLHEIGNSFDWSHTLETYNINYYKWTEWIFLELFKAGLAYRKKSQVNFCPKDKTVLSDEQVMTPKQAGKEPVDKDGNAVPITEGLMVCERCGTVVEKRDLDVWFFRITDYADKLLKNLKDINWSERVKVAQKEWIGKSEGVEVDWKVCDKDGKETGDKLVTFTTRKDTIPGVTFIVISCSSEYIDKVVTKDNIDKVNNYIKKTSQITDKKEKTGVFTGSYAKNPFNETIVPIYVTDYVLEGYGTGAVMGMPGHDKRDRDFAKIFDLPVIFTTKLPKEIKADEIYTGVGEQINTGKDYDGLPNTKAAEKIFDELKLKGLAKMKTNYHLRDWGIGRQRYWGCPIPMIYCENCAEKGQGYLSESKELIHKDHSDWNWQGWWPEENLPVELPEISDYQPEGNGRGPLANHPEFYKVKCPHCKADAKRETDVADTFLDSSWYFLRYPSVGVDSIAFDPKITKKWLPVNQYFGGAEHSVLHLMYSRFVTMVLHDLNYLDFEEPFLNFYAHGLVIKDGAKMSKSRGNVVNPDEYIDKFGADTLRTYLMFMGPMDSSPDFRDSGIEGMHRFIKRVWNLFNSKKEIENKSELNRITHQTIKKVTKDIEIFHYNTAISAIMEFVNFLTTNGTTKESLEVLCELISPFAPHIAEELWHEVLDHDSSIHIGNWPKYDESHLDTDKVNIIIQVDGKMRSQIEADKEKTEGEIKDIALADKKVQKWINGGKFKVIYIPGKIVNFVLQK